uniref:Uncharacterized protein n=1 Tax=viral metagenome TaxID=1070528 RepID=A0A6C0D3Y6_9ZZZZ
MPTKEELTTLVNLTPEPDDYVTQLKAALAAVDDKDQLKAAINGVIGAMPTMGGGKRRRRTNKRKGRKGKKSRKH